MTSVYDNERLAAGYAFDRPPVHRRILESARLESPVGRALDIGCGAGVSTAALVPWARQVVGVEPVPAMLAHRRAVAPSARFIVGTAEALPFGAASFGLVTAAGSLNYTDLPPALAEVARVLTSDGVFLLYDFAKGRHSPHDRRIGGLVRGVRAALSRFLRLAAAHRGGTAPRRDGPAPARLRRCGGSCADDVRRLSPLRAG
ncbi:class I SAM-dependent methyltransferase [Nonomuraea salmonea]|uniref:class I SAM-dependent methyltransferase n=1 Tax=Nonomuraea salmonea TaxID=46181 RepID=UPI0031ED99E1